MSVDENGVVTLSEEHERVRATPAEDLFLLAELDSAVEALEKKVAENNDDLKFYQAELAKTKKQLEEDQHRLKEKQRVITREEADVAELTSKRKALDQRMLRIASAKELTAMQEEQRKLDEEISAREEKLLGLYDEQENSTKTDKELAEKLERMTRAVEKKSSEKRAENTRLVARAERLRHKRGDYLIRLDPALAARYEKAHDKHGGVVVFAIDESCCAGCGMPPSGMDFNRWRQNPGKPFDCGYCGRLLVWVGAQGD